MNGLIIKPKWADLILSGKKTWEIRGSQIFGTVDLVDCIVIKKIEG